MSNFPLYDTIIAKLSENNTDTTVSISSEMKTQFTDFVKSSNQKVHEFIYMLIKVYQVKHGKTSTTNLPFNGKEQKTGIKFDIENLPCELHHILYMFYEMETTN
jgi:hypothetical protein